MDNKSLISLTNEIRDIKEALLHIAASLENLTVSKVGRDMMDNGELPLKIEQKVFDAIEGSVFDIGSGLPSNDTTEEE